jgi:hypothetical protein
MPKGNEPPRSRAAPPDPRLLAKDLEPFLAAGCVTSNPDGPDGASLDCSKAVAIKPFGCQGDRLGIRREISRLVLKGALAACYLSPATRQKPAAPSAGGVYTTGCAHPGDVRYVVADGGGFQAIGSASEFAARFGPVASPDEAIAFAVALTGKDVIYDLGWARKLPADQVEVRDFNPTSAVPAPGGFDVRLFHTEVCGCGPHLTRHEYRVTSAGVVSQTAGEVLVKGDDTSCVNGDPGPPW